MGAEPSGGCSGTLDEGPVRGETLESIECLPAGSARCAERCIQAGGTQSNDFHRTANKHCPRSAGEPHGGISRRAERERGEVRVTSSACKNVPSGICQQTPLHAKTCRAGFAGKLLCMQKRAERARPARLIASLLIFLALRLVGSTMGAEPSGGCSGTLDEGPVRGETLESIECLPAGSA
jgi:hypothetical protein